MSAVVIDHYKIRATLSSDPVDHLYLDQLTKTHFVFIHSFWRSSRRLLGQTQTHRNHPDQHTIDGGGGGRAGDHAGPGALRVRRRYVPRGAVPAGGAGGKSRDRFAA